MFNAVASVLLSLMAIFGMMFLVSLVFGYIVSIIQWFVDQDGITTVRLSFLNFAETPLMLKGYVHP